MMAVVFPNVRFNHFKIWVYITLGSTELGNKAWAPSCDWNNHCTQSVQCFNCPQCCPLQWSLMRPKSHI